MSKECCAPGDKTCATKKGCCSLKKVLGLVVVAGVAGFLWKKFR